MPKLSTVVYSTKQGVVNIKRNRMFSLASIGTMTACLFLFGLFYFVLANFQHILKSAETTVGMTVFFESGITDDDIYEIGLQIQRISDVETIKYISAEEAWNAYKEKHISEEAIASFGDDNPLKDSASYEVYLKDVSAQKDVSEVIKKINGVRQVYSSDEIADIFESINSSVAYISGTIIIILLCVATFLISTTVTMGISVRKQEISIMKLIGASDFFIRAPFVVEGVIIGAIGAGIPLIFLRLIYNKLLDFVTNKFSSGFYTTSFIETNKIFSTLIPVSFVIGIGIGFLGSMITVRKQLKKIN